MKPQSFTQVYIHLVFAVKHRDRILTPSIRPRLFEYIGAIINGMNHKSIKINGYIDHIHLLIGFNPTKSISETVYEIKRSSSLFINKNNLCVGHFEWQEGYGAFSYSRSQIDAVIRYIEGQENHHKKRTFRQEYLDILNKNSIEFNELYMFKFFE